MAKLVKYDVTGVEDTGGSTGVKVSPGVKVARIAICEKREQKTDGSPANDLRVALDVGPEYDWVFTYIGLGPASDWKLKEFTKALNLKDKGQFDPDKMVDKIIRVKINSDSYEGEYSPRAGKLFPAQPGDEVGSASEISTRTEDTPDEEDAPAAGADGFEPTREDPDDEEVGTYDEWEEDDVLAEAQDRGLTLPGGRGSKKDKAIKALRADDEAAGAAPEPAATGGGDDDAGADYSEWDLEQLEKEWGDREMGDLPAIRGRNREDRLKAAIIEELQKDDEDNPFEG